MLPLVRMVDKAAVLSNYKLIAKQVTELVRAEIKRIVGDPALKGFVVRR